jgi:cyclopropane-fatty-acyl-phospholipid synthase
MEGDMVLTSLLGRRIKLGTLHLQLPDGAVQTFGEGPPEVQWRLHSPKAPGRILRDPELELGETYMDGEWDAGESRLVELLGLLMRNFPESEEPSGVQRLLRVPQMFLRHWNRIGRSRRNVAHHYDIDGELFRLFLDEDMQYSCAYYYQPGIELEEAQRAKRSHIANKLLLEPGQRVLDIGSGWGGLALEMAEKAGVEVTGLTLSEEQLKVARRRAAERGLGDRVRFELQDYRQHEGTYDRIVSVGMFEHVGPPNFRRFFSQVSHLLAPGGIALLHTIGRQSSPGGTNPWIRKYIFPGGYIPALSEVSDAIERTGLVTSDVEVLRLHYADTLAAWQERFQRRRREVVERMGERFYRMWEFYLASCEASFRWRDLVVFQFQLAKELATVPVTRDYLYNPQSQGSAASASAVARSA